MKFGLEEKDLSKITYIFSSFPEIHEVIIYGSRAKGTFKKGSDIDLTVKGNHLDLGFLNRLRTQLDDLLLPYTFDISIFDQIDHAELREHIQRVGQVFFKKN